MAIQTVKKRVNVQETLLTLTPGQTEMVKTKLIKPSSIRSAIRELNKKGYQFTQTEKGLIDEVQVTRIS